MKRHPGWRWAAVIFVVVLIAVVMVRPWQEQSADPAGAALPPEEVEKSATLPRPPRPEVSWEELPPSSLNAMLREGITREERVRVVGQMMLDYYSVFQAIPTGTQEEIFARFRGKNSRGLVYYPDGHPAVDAAGRPLNGEGQPIIVHVVAATLGVFELRDAGADGEMYTEDDLVMRHPGDDMVFERL